MRLTIVNLLISGANGRGTECSASILARKPGKMNPPYAGRRTAADAAYKIGGAEDARQTAWHLCVWQHPHPGPPPRKRERGQVSFAANTDQERQQCSSY